MFVLRACVLYALHISLEMRYIYVSRSKGIQNYCLVIQYGSKGVKVAGRFHRDCLLISQDSRLTVFIQYTLLARVLGVLFLTGGN